MKADNNEKKDNRLYRDKAKDTSGAYLNLNWNKEYKCVEITRVIFIK